MLVHASKDGNAEVDRLEAGSACGVAIQRPPIEISALDKQVGHRARAPQRMDLRPEPPISEREVEGANTLPLHHPASSDNVVADPKRYYLDHDAELVEPAWYTARPLVNIGNNLRTSHLALQ